MIRTLLSTAVGIFFTLTSANAQVTSEVFLNIPGFHSADFDIKVSKLLGVYSKSVSNHSGEFDAEKKNIEADKYLTKRQKAKLVKKLGKTIVAKEKYEAIMASGNAAVTQRMKKKLLWLPFRDRIQTVKY